MKRAVGSFILAISLLVILNGCAGSGKKVVAKVNRDIITEDEFYARIQRVNAAQLMPALETRGRMPGRAGEFALQTMIAERLVSQYAAEKRATPSEAQITAYIAFAKKYANPQLSLLPQDPFREEADWRNDVKSTLAYRNLVMQSVKQDPAELQKLYEQYKPQLAERDQYHLRLIDTKSEKKAQESLKKLEKLPFETVALTDSEDPVSGPKSGDLGFVNDTQIPPPILAAVKKIKPGEYTKEAIKAEIPAGGAPPAATNTKTEPHYFIAQLVELKPGRVPTIEEVKPLLENYSIQQKDPGAFSRVQASLREFQEKSEIQINPKAYKSLEAKFKRSAGQGSPGKP